MPEELTPIERSVLKPFVTDLDAPIFGLRGLPQVVMGALFSRYSRSDKPLRRILVEEFLAADEEGNINIENPRDSVPSALAEAFYERVLIGYGDDSVAELGGAHIACEGVSNIAAKALEDSRIGLSPLEKSTRYVRFDRKVDGKYRYLREPAIMASAHAEAYEQAMDTLFDTYAELLDPTIAFLQARTPRDAQTSERAYNSAIRAKAFDLLRGLLPMATLTNVGLFGNGRAFEYLLTKLRASSLGELHALADAMQQPLDAMIPSFVKRAKSERGQALQTHLRGMRERVASLIDVVALDLPSSKPGPDVQLISYDDDAELRVAAAILYPHSHMSFLEALKVATEMHSEDLTALVQAYVGDRAHRSHRPGRAFEEARYTFDLCADIGAYRDLQRHRMLTQERQNFGVRLGYITPPELHEAGLAQQYCQALEHAAALVERIAADLPEQAQYAVPLAFRVRWRITLSLREVYHLTELRSAPQGHPSYRRIAQAIFDAVRNVHPLLAEGMRFVDMGDYALERLDAERRLDKKEGNTWTKESCTN